jgi:DNA-binding winged helix-turn-helix (wHTH) protein
VSQPTLQESARFGPFRLNTSTGELWKDDRKIPLQCQPCEILILLLKRSGEVVTPEEIRRRLWDEETTVVFEQSLATALKKLRRSLGDSASQPRYIETLARRGYRWIASVAWDPGSPPPLAEVVEPDQPALVGRAAPLATLRDSLRRASARERQILFITGEPGIGKTALITAFEREAARSVRYARGQCVEEYGRTEDYYPVLDAIGELCRGQDGASAIATLATQAPTWLVQFPALVGPQQREALQREILGATRERMLREICDALDTIARDQPLLLVLEDVHWADPSTIGVLSAIARRRTPAKLMVVATCRPVAPAAPLDIVTNDLVLHGLAREIALSPLSESDVADYLSAGDPNAPPSPELARLVHERSDGNPLFVVAALAHLEHLGVIARESGTFQIRTSLEHVDIGVPENLRRMIEVHIAQLGEAEQAALEIASVVGTSFAVSLCAAVGHDDADKVEVTYEALSRHSHIVQRDEGHRADHSPESRYAFVHDLYREVLYQRLAVGRRVRLHRDIGLELERLCSPDPPRVPNLAPELAHHFEAAGDWRRAATYLGIMADIAERRFVPRDVTALRRRALDLVARVPELERAQLEIELLNKLAAAYVVSFDPRAVETYETLIARAARHGSVMAEVEGLIGLAYPVSWVSATRSLHALQRALDLGEQVADPVTRARLRASCFVRRIWSGGWSDEDAAQCWAALDVIRGAGDARMLAKHLVDCNFVHWVSSHYRTARQEAIESLALLQETPEDNPYFSYAHWLSQFIQPWSLLFLGEWGAMLQELDAEVAIAVNNGDDYRMQTLRLYQAWLHLHAMDFAEVVSICASLLPVLEGPERTPWRRFGFVLAGTAEAALGHEEPALEHLLRVRGDMAREPVIHDWYTRMMLESALTDLWLRKGNRLAARYHARCFLEAAQATAERTWQALAWEANARLAEADRDLPRAQECVAQALAAMEGFDTPLAAWRVHATAAAVQQRAGNLADSTHHRDRSQTVVLRLAGSLPREHPLRATFLASPAIGRILPPTLVPSSVAATTNE